MTIGIGVLASTSADVKPDHLILLCDTKGSFGDSFSMNHLHKMFIDPKQGLYTIAAGKMDRAADLFKTLAVFFSDDTPGLKGYGKLFTSVHAASDCYKRVRFKYDVLPLFARHPQSIPEAFNDSDLTPELIEAWREFDFGCQMIVGSFDPIGTAMLFTIDGDGQVQNSMFPGFTAIGTGLNSAMFWLSYRQHNLGLSVKRAAYHAFEAKLMAESSPFVNDQIDIVIANKKEHFLLTRANPSPEGAPVTVADLRKMLRRYGIRETEGLK
jgi:hypothetical protein